MWHISTIFQFKLYVILGLLLTIFYVLRHLIYTFALFFNKRNYYDTKT